MTVNQLKAEVDKLASEVSKLSREVAEQSKLSAHATDGDEPQHDKEPHPYTKRHYALTAFIAFFGLVTSIAAVAISARVYWFTSEMRQEDIKDREVERQRAREDRMTENADHFIDRFYQIEKDRPTLKKDQLVDFYFERLYGLHAEEFHHYKTGRLDPATYLSWLKFRHRRYKENAREARQWERLKTFYFVDPDFASFMTDVLQRPCEQDIDAVLKRVVR